MTTYTRYSLQELDEENGWISGCLFTVLISEIQIRPTDEGRQAHFFPPSLVLCPFTLLPPYHFLPSPVFPCFQNQRYCNYTHRKNTEGSLAGKMSTICLLCRVVMLILSLCHLQRALVLWWAGLLISVCFKCVTSYSSSDSVNNQSKSSQ